MLFAKLFNASMTLLLASVQISISLNLRICHEMVRTTTHQPSAYNGSPLALIAP